MTEMLKPCPNPWCERRRGPAVYHAGLTIAWESRESETVSRPHKAEVRCDDCRVKGPGKFTAAEAINAWNARPSPSPDIGEMVERAKRPDALIDGLAERIKYVFDFNGCGFWRTCSGCYESEDGYPNGHYPHSDVLGCTLGGGCSECGGLGAVYDPIDYEEMASEMIAADALESLSTSSTDVSGVPEGAREAIARIAALHGLGTINGATRACPPNEAWEQDVWERRILDCIPSLALTRCYGLADAILSLLTASPRVSGRQHLGDADLIDLPGIGPIPDPTIRRSGDAAKSN